ncbi:hypothetical protein [Jiella sonneratiae]|uniref:hypothetical protein n=1 Tax=Jiella sonneratiae TaxID=2816856 RepID=UPI001A94DC54|nr:hypothetical protein [Jiella sonneratiae]
MRCLLSPEAVARVAGVVVRQAIGGIGRQGQAPDFAEKPPLPGLRRDFHLTAASMHTLCAYGESENQPG